MTLSTILFSILSFIVPVSAAGKGGEVLCKDVYPAPHRTLSYNQELFQGLFDAKEKGYLSPVETYQIRRDFVTLLNNPAKLWLKSILEQMERSYFSHSRNNPRFEKPERFNSQHNRYIDFFNISKSQYNKLQGYLEFGDRYMGLEKPDLITWEHIVAGQYRPNRRPNDILEVILLIKSLDIIAKRRLTSDPNLRLMVLESTRSGKALDEIGDIGFIPFTLNSNKAGLYTFTLDSLSHSINHFPRFGRMNLSNSEIMQLSRRNRSTTIHASTLSSAHILLLTSQRSQPNVHWVSSKNSDDGRWLSVTMDLRIPGEATLSRFIVVISHGNFKDRQNRSFGKNHIVSVVPIAGPNVYSIPHRQALKKALENDTPLQELLENVPYASLGDS